MSIAIEAQSQRRAAGAAALLPLALLLAAFALLQPTSARNPDVTWLLTVCEHVLDGQRLYVDIIETNPPASVWLYLPAVLLARLLHLAPETLVDLQFLALACGGLALAARILDRGGLLRGHDRTLLGCSALAVLVLMPRDTFGERDHALTLLALPILACLGLRAGRLSPGTGQMLASGALAGVALCVKPQFALALLLASAASMALARSWRVLLAPELWLAGMLAAAYGAAALALAPEFFADVLPAILLTYLPVRLPLGTLLMTPGFVAFALALLLDRQTAGGRLPPAPATILIAAAVGAMLAYLVQGKGWAYQTLPMVQLAALPLAIALAAPGASRAGIAARLAVLLGFGLFYLGDAPDYPALRAEMLRLPPHSSVMAISSDLSVGHPLVRQIGGVWAGRLGSLWAVSGAIIRRAGGNMDAAQAAQVAAAARAHVLMLAQDIAGDRPDVVLVDRADYDWAGLIDGYPELAAALAGYADGGAFDKTQILRRKTVP